MRATLRFMVGPSRSLAGVPALLALVLAVDSLLLVLLNMKYPEVGHDFSYILPHAIDVHLHYLVNGLSVQWYTPSFGGGLPAFANPAFGQFTLLQLFLFVLPLWESIEATVVVVATVGMVTVFAMLRRCFGAAPGAALMGASFFGTSGFFINHMIVGHTTFHAVALMPLQAWLLLDPTLPAALAVAGFALTSSYYVYSSAGQLSIAAGLSVLLTFTLCVPFARARPSWRRTLLVLTAGGALGGLMVAAKLTAVVSYMDQFPRLRGAPRVSSMLEGVGSVGLKMIGYPIFSLLGWRTAEINDLFRQHSGGVYGIWENDVYIPTGVFLVLAWSAFLAARFRTGTWPREWWVAVGIAWVSFELVLGRGFLYPTLKNLPLLESTHVNVRFASIFVLPLALGAALAFDRIVARKVRFASVVAATLTIVSVAMMAAYLHRRVDDERGKRTFGFDASQAVRTFARIRNGERFVPVENVAHVKDDAVFAINATSLRPYEPIFGYELQDWRASVRAGRTTETFGGAFNMTNPSSLVYPEGIVRVWDRIAVTDEENFRAFIHRRQPSWPRPAHQDLAGMISFGVLCVTLVLLVAGAVSRLVIPRGSRTAQAVRHVRKSGSRADHR